jgi:hypothetical protein
MFWWRSKQMDGTRTRRTRDSARQRWYARWRAVRFARHLGFRTTSPTGRLLTRGLTPRPDFPERPAI